MNIRELETKYSEMKHSFDNIVKANTKLSDEKTLALNENKYLNVKIDRALRYLEKNAKINKKELIDILKDEF